MNISVDDAIEGSEIRENWLRSVIMEPQTSWVSTKQASEFLGVNLRTLYRFIDEGELTAYKFGRVIRLKEDDLAQFVEASRIQPGSLEHLYPEPIRQNAS